MRAWLMPGLVGLAVTLAPLTAQAEDAPQQYPPCERAPTETEVQGAKGAFQAGQASFEEGDYARAISYWEDAYRRDCTAHALLLNLARAYELNNERRHAVNSLETFLARNPASNQRDQITRRIDGLKAKIKQEEQKKAAPSGDGSGTTAQPVEDRGPKRPITPLIVAGVGGVMTVVGGILYLGAASDVKDVEDQCGGRTCKDPKLKEEGNSARQRQTTWGIVTVGGLAVTAGGLIWYFVSKPETQEAGPAKEARVPRVAPALGPGFAGVSLSGNF